MNLKPVITLFLALVFQLAQVLPAAVVATPCQTAAVSCACCKGARSCHCAENGESNQKPSPAPFESGRVLKVPSAKPVGTTVAMDPLRESDPSHAILNSPQATVPGAYVGVRMSVAFCTFVI